MEVSGTALGDLGDAFMGLGLAGVDGVVAWDGREGEASAAAGDVAGGAGLVVVVGRCGGGSAAVVPEGTYFVLDLAQRGP